ncbi:MAG: pitrilysin family protein [Candidatus Pacearchaeota archaeon]
MKFEKKVLPNGLTILHEKRDVPVTTVMLAVKYGSAFETEPEKGIAHFIEHMCFKGTEKRTTHQIAEEVEKVGGDLNAFTSEEVTAYHSKIPSEHLALAMEVIFDIFFNASFPKDALARESSVICEEIKMYRDNPRAHVTERIKNNLYKKPFGMFIAGTEENVKGMTREQLLEKHRKIYVPQNSILCVVGNNDFSEIISLAEKLCVNRSGEKLSIPKIEKQNIKEVEKRGGISQANLAIGFHFPKLDEKERYSAEVFSAILGEGMSSKLFVEVREKKGLVYSVKTEIDAGKSYSYFMIWAGTDQEKVSEVIDICLKEFAKMAQISEKELEEAKIQVIGNQKLKLEDSRETATNLILEEINSGAEEYYKFEERINSVTLEDLKKLSEKSTYSTFVLSP